MRYIIEKDGKRLTYNNKGQRWFSKIRMTIFRSKDTAQKVADGCGGKVVEI